QQALPERHVRAARRRPRDRTGRLRLPPRRIRRRNDAAHPPPHPRRAHEQRPRRRRRRGRRATCARAGAEAPSQDRRRLPGLQAPADEDGRGERRVRAHRDRSLRPERPRGDRSRALARGALAASRSLPGSTLRRRAAAHRARPRARESTAHPHRRRADREPRPGDELGDHQAPHTRERARHDDGHGDAQRRDRERAPPSRRPSRSRAHRSRRARRPVRRMIRWATYIGTAAVHGFTRNPAMSLASTLTVTLMLTLFAFFLTTDRGLQAAVGVLESKVELAAYIDDNAKVSDVLDMKKRLEADPAVARVDYITKDQALQRLRDIAANRPDFAFADLSANPLPASLEIKMADAREAKRVASDLRAEVGKGVVYDVVDNPQVVDQLLTITRVLSVGGVAILGMMLFVALFVIVNTIRIAVHARRDEIEIMQLVGASDWFIRWPFILEGMIVGTLGAVVALAILFAAAGPVTTVMLDFLDILPLSFGPEFVGQLVASFF